MELLIPAWRMRRTRTPGRWSGPSGPTIDRATVALRAQNRSLRAIGNAEPVEMRPR